MLFLLFLFVLVVLGVLFVDGSSSSAMDEYCRLECWDEKITKAQHCC